MPISARGGGWPAGDCGDELEAEVERAAARLEADYPPERLRDLVANGGLEPESEDRPA